LAVGKHTVYQMLDERTIPGLKLKRGWLVTRYAYEVWKQNCGSLAA
jgi:hypothetical protein